MEWMVPIDGDGHSDRLFDLSQVLEFVAIAKRDAFAAGAGASRSADAMHVRFGFDRNIIINHMADFIDIDSARCHIGCDENADFAISERIENTLASILRSAAVDSFGRDSRINQRFVKSIRSMFSAHEDENAGARCVG